MFNARAHMNTATYCFEGDMISCYAVPEPEYNYDLLSLSLCV